MSDPTPHDEFLMWVGISITAWASVEEHLFQICKACLETREDRAAIVYYRTPNINARLTLVDELVRTRLPKRDRKPGSHDHPDLQLWTALQKDILALLGTRSRIAHHPVRAKTELGKTGGIGMLEMKTWLEIYVSEAERLRTRSEDIDPLTHDDLVQHTAKVQDIIRRLMRFQRDELPRHP